MEDISKLVQNYLSTFQQCLLNKDPVAHAKILPDSLQKNLLLFLLQPHSDQFKQILRIKYQLRGSVLESIDKWKIHSRITKAATSDQIKYLIDRFLRQNQSAYNYAKPAQFNTTSNEDKSNESSLPSQLKPIKSLCDWANELIQQNEDSILSLNKKAILCIDEEKLHKLKPSNKEHFLNSSYIKQYQNKFAVQFVKNFYEDMIKLNKNYEIPSHIFYNLTKSQFMFLKDVIPGIVNKNQYLKVWFSHSYDEQLQPYRKADLKISQKDQKRKLLLNILKDLDHLKTNKTKALRRNVLKQLIILDISREEVDKDYFIEYVRDNPNPSYYENQKIQQRKYDAQLKNNTQCQDIIELNIGTQQIYQNDIISECLQRLFKKQNALKIFEYLEQFFEVALLNKMYGTVKLSEGGKLQDYQNYLTIHELKQFKQKREITILDSNKKKWKVNEVVTLKVKVKNISDIHVQIYRLDLQKHFLQNNSEIDQTQDLSYLQPNHSYHYSTQGTNPYIVQTYDIKIQGVPQGRGVWIVQLQGEGISSRAFIRKGALANTSNNNTAGTDLKFYDQSGNQIKDYSIWMEGKKHDVKSSFIIPYGESDKNLSLVVVKDGYAQKFNVYVPRESYYIDMTYIYNSQSFIVGSIAKILLHPRLNLAFDRNIDVSLKLLQKVKILITLTNNLGIKSTISFDNVEFKSTEDYVLEFPVQSYTSNINILITAKVKKYNQKEQDLTSGHNIDINLSQGNTNFLDLYLQKKSTGYFGYLLGKNGEPIPRTEIIVQIQALDRTNEEIQNLMTSKDGSIGLGYLEDVQKITLKVNLKSGVIMRQWNLNNLYKQTDILVDTVHFKGKQIILPPVRKQKCHLWKIIPGTGVYTQNHNDKVTFNPTKVSIKDLPVGNYIIDFLQTDRTISFTVIDGKVWENQNKIYDQDKNLLYQIDPNQNNHISLGDAIIRNQEGKTIVEIPVNASYNLEQDLFFRGHLLASNFITPNFRNKFDINITRGIRQTKYQTFIAKQSQFYNNKKLSQETSYVIGRGKQKKYIGNNLEKPKIFLKRLEVRDTTQSQQVLDIGGQYNKARDYSMKHSLQQFVPSACPPVYGRGYVSRSAYLQAVPFVHELDLTTHNNFLTLPGTIISNKKNSSIIFQLPQGYSYLTCYAFNRFSGIERSYNFDTNQIKTKALGHAGIKNNYKDTAWTMSRQIYKVQKSQNVKVGRDSVWTAVGINNVLGFAKIKGASLQDWVWSWNSFSQQQKLKVYDEKVCHELNTYIKYNDQSFFEKIIQPFIRNKVTKTFVDLCLLQKEQALKWTDINLFQQLNQFQKVLLVHQLVKAERKQEAQNIVTSMESLNKANRKTFQQFKKQFDTVITAKLVEQAQIAPLNQMNKKKLLEGIRIRGSKQKSPNMNLQMQCMVEQAKLGDVLFSDDEFQSRGTFNQPFKQMEKTKQYTETTYFKLKYPHQSKNLVYPSPFWTSAAQHFLNGQGDLLTENFMYLTSAVQFTLASCFIPNKKLLEYNLQNQGENVVIQASSSFLIFVRQVKQVPFEKKFGALINQRFFNPDDRYYYEEDGTRIEKQTQQFIVRRPYCVQTLITNTSGTKLELQLLIDIPQGSIPLKSHQNTQIQSINLQPYSTLSFQRFFYFPSFGSFNLYPANACRGGLVIAKAEQIKNIEVLETQTIKKLDTLENVLKSGQQQTILEYLQTKNIFDSKIFEPSSILWMLKDKVFFSKAIQILRARKYYLAQVWIFGYYHSDIITISQFQKAQNLLNHQNVLKNITIFEYFPYYSSRAHKFLNENKSTIRNQQFKKTYFCFLFASLFNEPNSSRSRVAFIYYLLLQDRIDEAQNLLSLVQEQIKQQHRLQFDYIQCFIDMYKGYPTFSQARKIVERYDNYPVKAWQKLFKQISNTLKQYDSTEIIQENKKVEYSTTVLNEGTQLRISIPADTRVEVSFYDTNLQLFFSNFPFTDFQNFCPNIIPNRVHVYEASQSRQQKLIRDANLKDCFVEIYSSTSGLKGKKVSSFLWDNPNIKIKIKEDNGYAQVFYEGKRQAGCYCKVYQMKNGQSKFYRDGYTDITGTFKYALADLQAISKFSILFVTGQGGIVEKVKPPSQQAYLV